jgi:hypothetical protein
MLESGETWKWNLDGTWNQQETAKPRDGHESRRGTTGQASKSHRGASHGPGGSLRPSSMGGARKLVMALPSLARDEAAARKQRENRNRARVTRPKHACLPHFWRPSCLFCFFPSFLPPGGCGHLCTVQYYSLAKRI